MNFYRDIGNIYDKTILFGDQIISGNREFKSTDIIFPFATFTPDNPFFNNIKDYTRKQNNKIGHYVIEKEKEISNTISNTISSIETYGIIFLFLFGIYIIKKWI